LFAGLALTDLSLTWLLLQQSGGGAYEWNPIASWWLARFGWCGLGLFKLGIVGLIGLVARIVSRHRPQVADRLLAFGCAVHLAVIVYSGWLVPRVIAQADQTAKTQAVEQQVQLDVRQFGAYRSLLSELRKDVASRHRSLPEAVAILSRAEWVHRPEWRRCMALRYPTSAKKELLAALLIDQGVASAARPNQQTDLHPRLAAESRFRFGRPGPSAQGGRAEHL
jgi:hypothetical protein